MTMRLRNLAAVAAVGTSLLMLGVPAASARKHPSPNGLCNLNINVAPRLIEAGESALVFGRLRCGARAPSAVAGRTVRLMQRAAGARECPPVQTPTTDAPRTHA